MLKPFEPERDKGPDQRGLFLSPAAFGHGDEKALMRRPSLPKDLPRGTNMP